MSFSALTLWCLGYPDQAESESEAALALAVEGDHPYSSAFAYNLAAILRIARREPEPAMELSSEALRLCREHGFPLWHAAGSVLNGWARVALGQGEGGIRQMREGLDAWQATGAEMGMAYYYSLLGEALGRLGRTGEGLEALEEAAEIAGKNQEFITDPVLFRVRGDLLEANKKTEEAESNLLRALEVARRQRARSLELSAAGSLARVWMRTGRERQARNLLKKVLDWFSEGLGTRNLLEARALLEELK